MSNSLSIIQKLSKAGSIISKIIFICSIVGVAFCAIGVISLALGAGSELVNIGGISIKGIIETEAGTDVNALCISMVTMGIMCAFEIPIARCSYLYFEHELEAGTPFTESGALELRRLGIITIILSASSMAAASLAYVIMSSLLEVTGEIDYNNASGVGIGIVFLIVSLILRHGAEISR